MNATPDRPRSDDHADRDSKRPSWRRTLVVCLVILALGAGIVAVVFSTEPEARRAGATRRTPMLVDVVTAERGTYRPQIVAMGTVEAARDVILRPRVAGEIMDRASRFEPGGFLAAGQTVVRLDPADHENVLRQRESDLSQATADLELEMGRQSVAELDYELLEEDQVLADPDLVLRRPQLLAARARVAAARAAVRQAELDLARTRVAAPFDAHVLTRAVDVGSQVAAGDALGRLVGLDVYWVVTTVPRDRLRWLAFPASPDSQGAPVTIHDPAAWPDGVTRTGHLSSRIGALDDATRLARVVVTVPDPLARRAAAGPPLTIGAYVEARIEARPVSDVVRLDRDLVRQDDTVWVMQDDTLAIRDVRIVLRDERHAYIDRGLDHGDRVVTTDLATVAQGAPLRLQAAGADTGAASGGAAKGSP